MLKNIKVTFTILVCLSLLVCSCVISRKKNLEKLLEKVDTDPKDYFVTLKTDITDIISLKAQIENSPGAWNFMLDTGSPLTYSFRTKDSTNMESKKLFRFGKYKFDYGSGSITVGNVKFKNVGYLITDYVMEDYKEVAGLIGSSMLQTSVCEINFADSTVTISNSLKNFLNVQNSYTCSFQKSESQGTPVIKIALGNDTVTAFVDTGYSGLIKLNNKIKLSSEQAAKQESVSNSRYFGYPGKDHLLFKTYYQPYRLGLFGMELDSTILVQDPQYQGRNLVGLAFLKKFIVTINWVDQLIYLKPITDIKFRKNIYSYGFTCWKQENELRVLDIFKGSEFDRSGIKSGDIIVSINNSTDISDAIISGINSNATNSDSIVVNIKNKKSFSLKKEKLFN